MEVIMDADRPSTFYDIKEELDGARRKFPTNKHMMSALTEEVGELAQALIDCDRKEQTVSQVYREAMQVACMAIRVAEEGSQEFEYKYTEECSEKFCATK